MKTNRSGKSIIAILIGALVIAFSVAGAGFYVKKVNDKKLADEAERLKVKNSQESITSFYREAFAGVDLHQLPIVMEEIKRSRQPFRMIGYTETDYNCSKGSCRFIYELNEMFVFSVIDKYFFDTVYEGSFTENTLNFEGVIIQSGEPRLLDKMNAGSPVDAVKCSNLLNYVYGYNSVVAQADRVKVSKLPFSSVISAEQQFPLYRNSYGLMTGVFEVHVPDDFYGAYLFSEKNPYRDLFIVKNIEKSVKTGADVILKGVFICKK